MFSDLRAVRVMAIVAMCLAAAGVGVSGQDQNQDQKKPDPAAEMAAWEEMQKPGPEHELLKKFVGEWTADVTTFMPDGTSMMSTGKETSKLILGDRFVESHYSGMMMGKPFEGRAILGYDKMMKKYVNTWLDNLSTGVMVFYGDTTPDGKVLTCYSERTHVAGKTEKWKSVTTLPDDQTITYEMIVILPDAKEMKVMSIVYTKAE